VNNKKVHLEQGRTAEETQE